MRNYVTLAYLQEEPQETVTTDVAPSDHEVRE